MYSVVSLIAILVPVLVPFRLILHNQGLAWYHLLIVTTAVDKQNRAINGQQ
jgi:hypothetical protein